VVIELMPSLIGPRGDVALLLPLAAPLDFRVDAVAIVARESRPLTGLNLSIVHAEPGQKLLFRPVIA
jgi:hypothetical protein